MVAQSLRLASGAPERTKKEESGPAAIHQGSLGSGLSVFITRARLDACVAAFNGLLFESFLAVRRHLRARISVCTMLPFSLSLKKILRAGRWTQETRLRATPAEQKKKSLERKSEDRSDRQSFA
jgi:hypothetical protein